MKFISRVKKFSISLIIVSFVLGLVFVFFPEFCVASVSYIIGASLIAVGIIGVIRFFLYEGSKFSLFLSIVVAIFGLIILVNYIRVVELIVILLGAAILLFGLFNFFTAIKIIASSILFGWVTLILSIATSVLGIIAIVKAQQVSTALFILMGAALIVYSVMGIIAYFQVRKISKNIKASLESGSDIEVEGSISE